MLATGSLRFCGCPLMTVPHSPADHAQPSGRPKRREVVVAGKRVKTVDVHAHCCVPKAMAVIGHPLEAPGLLMDGSAQGPDQLATRIAAMDAQGIDVEALSINPYWYKADKDQSAELIRLQNETLVEFCAANPERFVAYATAALQHPELAAEQVEHAVKKLGFTSTSCTRSWGSSVLTTATPESFTERRPRTSPVEISQLSACAPTVVGENASCSLSSPSGGMLAPSGSGVMAGALD